MGDSSRSVTSICGPCEYITPIGVRVPHNQPKCVKGCSSPKFLGTLPSDYLSVTPSESEGNIELVNEWPEYFLSHAGSLPIN